MKIYTLNIWYDRFWAGLFRKSWYRPAYYVQRVNFSMTRGTPFAFRVGPFTFRMAFFKEP